MPESDFVFRNQKPLVTRKVGVLYLEKTKKGDPKINIIIDQMKGVDKLRLFALASKKNPSQFVIYRFDNKDNLFDESPGFQKAVVQ